MQPQRRSQSTARTVTLFVLLLMIAQFGAPGAGLAGASSVNSKPAVAGPENYDIRVNGGASLATLLGRYAPGGARSAATAFRAKAAAMRAGLAQLAKTVDADLLVAGGVRDLAGIRRVRDAGATGIILGEALLSGAIDYSAALEAAA